MDLGLIPYKKALNFQLQLLEKVYQKIAPETLIVCCHPPVLTVGRSFSSEDMQHWNGDVFFVQRGGGVTFHGPGQIIVYPILDLNQRHRDLHKVLRSLERSVIDTLKHYGVQAGCKEGATGVWISERKIASIGIGAKKWISYHGLAFNFKNEFLDQGSFQPCGFSQETMIGFTDLVKNIDRKEFTKKLLFHLKTCLENP